MFSIYRVPGFLGSRNVPTALSFFSDENRLIKWHAKVGTTAAARVDIPLCYPRDHYCTSRETTFGRKIFLMTTLSNRDRMMC